jgi:hypothetical protein
VNTEPELSQSKVDVSDVLKALQHEVQRKLGSCMLRLQQYERSLKTMVRGMAEQGVALPFKAALDPKLARIHKRTLGELVGIFTGVHLIAASSDVEVETNDDAGPGSQSVADTGFRIRFNISTSPERYAQTKDGLAELVALRNELVHHLIERFDISHESGCIAASSHLDVCFEKIDNHCKILETWATGLAETQALTLTLLQSKLFEDMLVHGINPDGSVYWPGSTIVECLRDAETACQVDGWTSLDAAIKFISKANRDQTPSRYGCKTWRQVLKKSELFELQSKDSSAGARGHLLYRSFSFDPAGPS